MASGGSKGALGTLEKMFQNVEKNRKNDIKDAIDNRNFIDLFFLCIVCVLDGFAFVLEALVKLPLLFIGVPTANFLGISKYVSRTIDVTKNTDDALENILVLPRQFFMRVGYYVVDFKEDWDIRKRMRKQGKTNDQIQKEINSIKLSREQKRSAFTSQRTYVEEVEKLRQQIKKPTQSFLNPNAKNSMGDHLFNVLILIAEKISEFLAYIVVTILENINSLFSAFLSMIIMTIFFVFGTIFSIIEYVFFVLIDLIGRIPIIGAIVPGNYLLLRYIKQQSRSNLLAYVNILKLTKKKKKSLKGIASRSRSISESISSAGRSIFRMYYNVLLEILSILTGVFFRIIIIFIQYAVETFSQVEFFLLLLTLFIGFFTYKSTDFITQTDFSVSSSSLNLQTWIQTEKKDIIFTNILILSMLFMSFISSFRLMYRNRAGIYKEKEGAVKYVNEAKIQREEFWYTLTKVFIFICTLMAIGSIFNVFSGGITNIKATLPFFILWIAVGEVIRDIRTLAVEMRVPTVKHVKWMFILAAMICSYFISDITVMIALQFFSAFIAFCTALSIDKVEEQRSVEKRYLFFYIGVRILLLAFIFAALNIIFLDEFMRIFVYLKFAFNYLFGFFSIEKKTNIIQS